MNSDKELLIIFAKVPELGKAKTRLAVSVGNEKALEIYQALLSHTHAVTSSISQDKIVYYTPHIVTDDQWEGDIFHKALQSAGDLGERMQQAFAQGFAQGYSRICIIGTDCFELTTQHLTDAFTALHEHDVVLGPSQDGGYYLLGMNQLYTSLFSNKEWSTESVAENTRDDVTQLALSLKELPVLNDIDTVEDLKQSPLGVKLL
ncbi:MAG: TIGR04282 family arsenosugar biosynthesis glycosyltransferase [Tunicatimonas sp.]|uniref:TIGR04282 family arsenosugar biosynthesis glycosyltransferase n=1 Tax=Tunicatimonas sp. TaxID=1940096 RepID=UPI003C753936